MDFLPIIIIFSIYGCYALLISYQIFKILTIYMKHQKNEGIAEANKYFMFRRNDLQKWDFSKKIEIIFCAIFLLPSRLIILIVSSLNLIILIRIFSPLKKIHFVRVLVRFFIRTYCRLMLLLSGFYFIKTTKKPLKNLIPNYKNQTNSTYFPLVICNHISWVDSVFLMSKFSGSFLSKKDMQHMPIISHIGAFLDLLYIDRSKEEERQQIIKEIGERILKKPEIPLIIFPEGTTSNGVSLLTFKKGSFYFMNPVKIICIRYPRKNFNPLLDHVTGMGTNVLLSFCQFYNSLEVFELEVLDPANIDGVEKWEDYAKIVRDVMGTCLGVKQVEMGFRDSMKYGETLMKKKGTKRNQVKNLEKVTSK